MDRKELINFLGSRGSKYDCPFCGYNKWETVGDVDEFGLPARSEVSSGPGIPHIAVVILVCQHCGFVRPHAVDVVTGKWQAVQTDV